MFLPRKNIKKLVEKNKQNLGFGSWVSLLKIKYNSFKNSFAGNKKWFVLVGLGLVILVASVSLLNQKNTGLKASKS